MSAPLASSLLYFDDLSAGLTFRTQEIEISADDIVRFATKFDPQPFHLDDQAAKGSVFGGLASSGWMTAALTMRLIVEGEARLAGGWVGMGLDLIQWPCPVRPGDRISAVGEFVSKRVSGSRPSYGIVKVSTKTYNQHHVMVQHMVSNQWVPLRPKTGTITK